MAKPLVVSSLGLFLLQLAGTQPKVNVGEVETNIGNGVFVSYGEGGPWSPHHVVRWTSKAPALDSDPVLIGKWLQMVWVVIL